MIEVLDIELLNKSLIKFTSEGFVSNKEKFSFSKLKTVKTHLLSSNKVKIRVHTVYLTKKLFELKLKKSILPFKSFYRVINVL